MRRLRIDQAGEKTANDQEMEGDNAA